MRKTVRTLTCASCAALLAFSLAGCSGGSSNSQNGSSSQESSSSQTTDQGTSTEDQSSQTDSSQKTSAAAGSLQGVEANSDGIVDTVSSDYEKGKFSTATVTVKGYKPFKIKLSKDEAPITVSNFCELAKNGYYDGLAFYRIASGFCLQGGTKGNTASGGDAQLSPIKGEFSSNGAANSLADDFDEGVVAMARTTDVDSATSTFFITLGKADAVGSSLNGQYAAFGTIDKAGMKIVSKIVKDYAKYADDANMGCISNEKNMPIIKSIKIS